MSKHIVAMVVLLTTVAAFAFQGFNGSSDLKLFNKVQCSLGLDCSRSSDKLLVKASMGAAATFTDLDATPSVAAGVNFETGTSAVTITDFDGTGIYEGQVIVVISKGAITYDVTSSGLIGGTTDIITASGDVTMFMYDGADWYVISRVDASDNLN
jgi:hypothetical protein